MTRQQLLRIVRAGTLIVVSLLLLIGIGGSVASHYFKREILRKLPGLAAKATDGLYKVSVEDLRINVFTGEVTVYGLRLKPDSAAVARKGAAAQMPVMLLNLYVPRIMLRGVKWGKALKEKELSCRQASLEAPDIRVSLTGSTYRSPAAPEGPTLKDVQVRDALINEPRISVAGTPEAPFDFKAEGGDIRVHDWRYIPAVPDTSRFFYALSTVAHLRHIHFQRSAGLYAFNAEHLYFNTDSSRLRLDQMTYAPSITYDSAYKRIGHRVTLFNFTTGSAALRGFDWRGFVYRQVWRAEQLSLNTPVLEVYSSKVPPRSMLPRQAVFPDDFLKELGHQLYVPYVVISNGTATYREQDDKTRRDGTVLFNNMDGLALHLTNDTAMPASAAVLLVAGTLFDRSPFGVALRFNTNDTAGHFAAIASVTNLSAAMIARPVEVMSLASVRSLEMHRMDMKAEGNKDSAEGDFTIQYEKLRVRLQHYDTVSARVKGRHVLSFMANTVFLYPSNPMPGAALRGVHPVVYGDGQLSFFALAWKLIFNGIQQTALRDSDMLKRFAERRKKHLVKKLQKKTSSALNAALE